MQIQLWHALLAITVISWAFFLTRRAEGYDGIGGGFLLMFEFGIAIIVTLVVWLLYFIVF